MARALPIPRAVCDRREGTTVEASVVFLLSARVSCGLACLGQRRIVEPLRDWGIFWMAGLEFRFLGDFEPVKTAAGCHCRHRRTSQSLRARPNVVAAGRPD